MFRKTQLLILTWSLLVFGCKYSDIDYSALDEDGGIASSPWAMVDLYLLAADDAEDTGEIVLSLSEHLAQDTDVDGVSVKFVANGSLGSLDFSAPDANNVVTLADAEVLLGSIEINFFNGLQQVVCPDNPIVASTLTPDGEDGVMFTATDLACAGNKMVAMNRISVSIEELSASASPLLTDHRETLKEVEKFYQQEKAKGEKGALHRGKDENMDKQIENFLIRRKMLKAYDSMLTEVGKHANLTEIKEKIKNPLAHKDSDKHIVIPATLNALLDVRVNNRITPDDNSGTAGDDTNLLLLKEAMGNAVAKFLMYSHLFQSDDLFASDETMRKFNEVRSKLPQPVAEYIDTIEKTFDDNKSEEGVYRNSADIYKVLNARLTCMQTFLIQKNEAGEACEEVLGEFYNGLTSLHGPTITNDDGSPGFLCQTQNNDEENDDGDVLVLLTTKKIMQKTNIHEPCKDYKLKFDKFNSDPTPLITAGVKDMKNSVIKNMNDMLKNYYKKDFQAKLLQNSFYAAVPVVTKHPEKATEMATAVAVAHKEVYKKRKKDEFWQGFFGWVYKAAAVVGIASLVLWLIPPAGAIVTGATSLLAALAVGAGGVLVVGYGSDWFHERRDYAALEKAIYSGGYANVAGLANTMQEWKQAKSRAIWEGIFVTVGVGGARRIITDPRRVRTAYSKANIQNKFKSWKDGVKNWRAKRQAAKAAAKSDDVVAAAQKLKDDIADAKSGLKTAKKNLREAQKNLRKSSDDASLKATVTEADEKLKTANKLHKDLLAKKPKGIVARTKERIAAGLQNARSRVTNLKKKPDREMVDASEVDEVKGILNRTKVWLNNARKSIYGLNRGSWKSSERIKDMNKFAKNVKSGGGKLHWKLRKDGTAVFKSDTTAHNYLMNTPEGATMVKDFKLGADGLWIAVLSAEKVDRLLGDTLKESIEGGLQNVRETVAP